MPRTALDVPPGAPTVLSAGPALPAEATNTTLWRYTSSSASDMKRPAAVKGTKQQYEGAPHWQARLRQAIAGG